MNEIVYGINNLDLTNIEELNRIKQTLEQELERIHTQEIPLIIRDIRLQTALIKEITRKIELIETIKNLIENFIEKDSTI